MTAPWGAGALHQRLNAFVKKSLIQQLVPSDAVVCDLYCGRGVDTENWGEAKIGKYVGVDLSSSALEEAKEEWERNEKPFVARFCELNPCMVDLEKHLGVDRLSVDVVTCLSHLQDCFANEDMVRQLLKNVASLLKPGGFFFGATPDSSTIWYKYQKAVEGAMKAGSLRANGHLPRVRTELYSISFEDDRFNEYGSRYQLRFADESVPPQSQILVHFPSLIRRAEELGLECVEIQNLTEFYEDYRVPFAESLQTSCGTLVDAKGHPVVDGKSRLSPVAQDVLSLYTTFIFKKPDPLQREKALKRAALDAKKSKKLFSPAVPEDRPLLKKQRLLASPAVVITSNGSKMPQPTPVKQEKVKTVPKPEPVARSTPLKPSKPSTDPEKARTSVERMQQKTESSPSVSKAKKIESPKRKPPEVVKVEASQLVSKITVQKPSEVVKVEASQLVSKITVQKPPEVVKVEAAQVDSKITVQKPPDVVKVEGSQVDSKVTDHGTDTTNKPAEPVKRKRVSRWSSEYVPKATTFEQEKRDQVSRFGSSQATPASYHHQPVAKPPEPPEEGEVRADDPVPGHQEPQLHPKLRKKEIAMDVFRSTEAAAFELASSSDMEFERGSKLSQDASSSDRFGSWETKPQRYTLRRAASLSEGGVESPWSRGGGRPPYQLRPPGAAPGLLGVAPVFGDRGNDSRQQRFEDFTRPSLRGNMYKHDRGGAAPGDGGNGAPWEDNNHFQGDARSRVNR